MSECIAIIKLYYNISDKCLSDILNVYIWYSVYWRVGCPNFASKKVSLQSETKRNANSFASFSQNSGKKISLNFALFRFKSFASFR